MSGTPVGFIGLGRMGTPMTRNLIDAGFAVTGHDTDAAAMDRLAAAGGTPAAAPDGPARAADLLILMLPDSAAVESVTAALTRAGPCAPAC